MFEKIKAMRIKPFFKSKQNEPSGFKYVAWGSTSLGLAELLFESRTLKDVFDFIITKFERDGTVIICDPSKDHVAENTIFGRAIWNDYPFEIYRTFFDINEDGCPQWTFFICKKGDHKQEVVDIPKGKIVQTNGCACEFRTPDHVIRRIRIIRNEHASDEGNV